MGNQVKERPLLHERVSKKQRRQDDGVYVSFWQGGFSQICGRLKVSYNLVYSAAAGAGIEKVETVDDIALLIKTLQLVDAKVLCNMFGRGTTLGEIADLFEYVERD